MTRAKVTQAHCVVAGDLRLVLLERFPDLSIAHPAEWKKRVFAWATTIASQERRGKQPERMLEFAKWALDNGYIIAEPLDVYKKWDRIIQHRSEARGAPSKGGPEVRVKSYVRPEWAKIAREEP